MKSNVLSASAAVFVALGIGLAAPTAAQNPPPASSASQNPPSAPSASSPGRIMVTGCVQPAAPNPTGTSGTAGSASAETKFQLTNAATSPTSPQSAGGASTSASTAKTYRLDADDAKLTPHVGHKVEISGTLDSAGASETPSASASSSANMPKLKVDTVKMVAANCAD